MNTLNLSIIAFVVGFLIPVAVLYFASKYP